MKNWIIRMIAAGGLLTSAGLSIANPPTPQPLQTQPIPGVPYGYYPTQWRTFPSAILDPEIRIILTPETKALPDPMITIPNPTKKDVPPTVEPKKEAPPSVEPKKEVPPNVEPKKEAPPSVEPRKPIIPGPESKPALILPEKDPAPKPNLVLPEKDPAPKAKPIVPEEGPVKFRKIYPPDHIPEVKPIYRDPMQPISELPEMRVPIVPPEIKVFEPRVEPPPAVKPQILNLLPDNGSFRRTEPFKNAGEEESEPRKPAAEVKPKAWLELPLAVPMPIVRGSSHPLEEKPKSGPVWKSIRATGIEFRKQ